MSTRPTVCFLTGTLNAYAGAERMTAVIANALAARGYRILILSLWDKTSAFPLHANVVHDTLFDQRPSFKRQYFSTVAGIRRFVRAHQVDVLIEVDTMLTLFTLPATAGIPLRRIAWEHCHFDEDLGKRTRRLARRIAAMFDFAVVVLTQRDKDVWQARLAPRCRVMVIANPLPFPLPPTTAVAVGRRVLAVGRLTHAKGFDILLKSWSLVAPSSPGWSLEIIGEGEERAALQQMVHELGLGSSVTLPGTVHDVQEHYREASVFCLSSRYEGFGLVLIEAMSFGLGIVSTNCEAGPREILRHEQNALVTATEDATALAEALTCLMGDELRRLRLGNVARADAENYDLDAIIDRWTELLQQ